ncbi:MAG: hypothetical protein Q8M39_08210 [Sulfuricurvum sp.]|nr:hypothetical protein [Sulfuricurvum sp.]
MRFIIYIILLALVAMLYKTFYWDYQKKEISLESNTSIEETKAPEVQPVVEIQQNDTTDEQNRTGWQSRKGMPIDRLGDSIGDSLKDKIKVK